MAYRIQLTNDGSYIFPIDDQLFAKPISDLLFANHMISAKRAFWVWSLFSA